MGFSDAAIVDVRLASRGLRLTLSPELGARIEGPSADAVRRLCGWILENTAGAVVLGSMLPRRNGGRWQVEVPARVAHALPFLAWRDRDARARATLARVRPHFLSSRSRVQLLRRIAVYAHAYGVPREGLPPLQLRGGRWRFLLPTSWVLAMARDLHRARRNAAGAEGDEEDDGFDTGFVDDFCGPGFHATLSGCEADDVDEDVAGDPVDNIDCQPPNFLDDQGNCRGPEEVPTCGAGFELSGGMCCRIGQVFDPVTGTCSGGGGGGTVATPPGGGGTTTTTTTPGGNTETTGGGAAMSENTKYAIGAVLILAAAGVGVYLAKRKKKRGR